MPQLLIDTNKYLGFYQSERIAVFIPVLQNVRAHVFVPQQIVDEVVRNKVACFKRALADQLKTPQWTFPDHLLPPSSASEKLIADMQKLLSSCEAMRRRLREHFDSILLAVANSADHISEQLTRFFGDPCKPNQDQLTRAGIRKRVNNPPGKHSDPVGDELIWEQFLDHSAKEDEIWVVSGDEDYFVTTAEKNKPVLNPLLAAEVAARKSRKAVYCFRTLAEAVPHYLHAHGLSKSGLPAQDKLEELASEERLLAATSTTATTTTSSTTTTTTTTRGADRRYYFGPKPSICQNCSAENTFNDGAYLRSQYGGLTLQYVCSRCGYHFDTGDSWD